MPKKPIDHSIGLPDGSRSQRGATVVEFAFIAGLVFLIIFGILEFGLIFLQEHYVANAAREGARIGVRANNFKSFDEDQVKASERNNCLNLPDNEIYKCTDRRWRIEREVNHYLDVFYPPEKIQVSTTKEIDDENQRASLSVTVTIKKSDIIKSGFIPFKNDIIFTTVMDCEDFTECRNEPEPK